MAEFFTMSFRGAFQEKCEHGIHLSVLNFFAAGLSVDRPWQQLCHARLLASLFEQLNVWNNGYRIAPSADGLSGMTGYNYG